ncbi:hypothetical protein EDC01DRAFT_11342 [Geopyxis carbonaria]|nr:hypothetical protein EDC01DRAFT_11342 [Geopyxis carbonaria]
MDSWMARVERDRGSSSSLLAKVFHPNHLLPLTLSLHPSFTQPPPHQLASCNGLSCRFYCTRAPALLANVHILEKTTGPFTLCLLIYCEEKRRKKKIDPHHIPRNFDRSIAGIITVYVQMFCSGPTDGSGSKLSSPRDYQHQDLGSTLHSPADSIRATTHHRKAPHFSYCGISNDYLNVLFIVFIVTVAFFQ